MVDFRRSFRALGQTLVTVAFLTACGGSHGASTLPSLPGGLTSAPNAARAAAAVAGGDVVAINAGGAGTGGFAADGNFVANGTWTYSTSAAINTSAVANPGPAAIYQDEREGASITYTIPGLTARAAYTVKLSFAELYWTAAGKRTFNASINGTSVLTNFDIFASAGAKNKAIVKSFTATASPSGTIAITLTAVVNYASIDAVEVAAGAGTPTPTPAPAPTPTPSGGLAINAGGAATGGFTADRDYVQSGTYTSSTTSAIDTSAVTSPAPQAVYADQRVGPTISYTIPGLTAGAAYTVRLEFAELYWTAAGKRVFTITINNAVVRANFDIFATAGTRYKAVAQSFTTTAGSSGTIAIALTASTNYSVLNALEVTPARGTAPTPTPTATPTPSPAGFNDYTTFGYDNGRSGFNPNSTAITPASLSGLHLAWQAALGGGDYNTWAQPILATGIAGHAGVLFTGGGSGRVYGYDALTGKMLWQLSTGQETYTCEGGNTIVFGVGGTAAYDPASKSLYIVGNKNSAPNALSSNSLYHLDGASGAILGQVDFTPLNGSWPSLDFSHTSVTLGKNGLAYVGSGATCDISSWRGRVAAVRVPSMTLANSFFTVWDPQNAHGGGAQPWGGGGVWGWGGVSLDASGNVYTGVGNTDNGTTEHGAIKPPFAKAPREDSGLGDAFIKISADLSTLGDANHPIPDTAIHGTSSDLDLQGTPVLFSPSGVGCDPMAALQAKSGSVYLYDRLNISGGPVAHYQLAPSTYADGFLGGPAYSPATGLLYVGVSSSNQSLFAPGMVAINPGCGHPSVAWHAAFGPDSYSPGSLTAPGKPRSVPAVSAGGVILIGTICAPSGSSCAATTTSTVARTTEGAVRKPLICCAPPGTGGGAVWALDASSGTVLNGGNPLIITSGPLRMPPTIDGNWIFVLDNSGNLYALTIDPRYAAINTTTRAVDSRMLTQWELPPRP